MIFSLTVDYTLRLTLATHREKAYNMSTVITPKPTLRSTPKKVPIPFFLRVIRWTFPKLEVVAPRLANRWLVKLFFTPQQYPQPAREKSVIHEAEKFEVLVGGKKVQGYTWGSGPAILFVHGWSGRPAQFAQFIEFCRREGYQAVAFDAPAHGLSEGKQTTVVEFKNAILAISQKTGPFHAVIAHSLGGVACLLAINEGLSVNTLVMIATPSIGEEILSEFAGRINASSRAIHYLRTYIHQTLGKSFDEFSGSYLIRYLPPSTQLLIMHDRQDGQVSMRNPEQLVKHFPQATFLKTAGLGHNRILRDVQVIRTVFDYINNPQTMAYLTGTE